MRSRFSCAALVLALTSSCASDPPREAGAGGSGGGAATGGGPGSGGLDAGGGTGGGLTADASADGSSTDASADGAGLDATSGADAGPFVAPDLTWTWFDVPGSLCRDGSTAGVAISRSSTSSELMIYLGGGGACFDGLSCLANPGNTDGQKGEQRHGLFDRSRPENPVRDASFVYVPYCTGDLHLGGNPTGDLGGPQQFVGYTNIATYLERIVPTFPNATQVLLTGTGPGGMGALGNLDQVQAAFGSVPVHVLDDSGPPLSSAYVAPCFQTKWRTTWGLDATVLAACGADCSNPDDYWLDLARHMISKHPASHIGLVEATSDSVSNLFYGFGTNGCAPAASPGGFPSLAAGDLAAGLLDLRAQTASLANFTTYLPDATLQSWISGDNLYDASTGGVLLSTWVAALLGAAVPSFVGPGPVTFDTTGPAPITAGDAGGAIQCNGAPELCDRPFDQVVFPAAHNAMQDFDSGRLLPNQTHGIPQQLEDGVRMFLMDTYTWAGVSNLCHASCQLGNEPLVNVLVQMRRFLDRNPYEVLAILFEDSISASETSAAFTAAGLDAYAYTHPTGGAWPTLRQMIQSGQRLLVTAQSGGPPPSWYHHGWDLIWETPYTFATPADFSCARLAEGGPSTNDLYLMNHWLQSPVSSPTLAITANAHDLLLARAQQCQTESGKLPNFIAVDHYSVGDLFSVVREMNGLPP